MATLNISAIRPTPSNPPSNPVIVPPHFRRLYRAFVQPQDSRGAELTAFVAASSREAAMRKICHTIAAMEFGSTPESVEDRTYNCSGAAELIAEGLGDDIESRLLETGWSGGKPVCFVEHPLVLLADPAPLLRVWARVTRPVTS
jgi:hypothetical protein